jgi:hypothetical protein
VPTVDSDNDGMPYPCDPDEGSSPFSGENEEFNDSDGDSLPDKYDCIPLANPDGSPDKASLKDGLIDKTLLDDPAGLGALLQSLEMSVGPNPSTPPTITDLNGDGMLFLSELVPQCLDHANGLMSQLSGTLDPKIAIDLIANAANAYQVAWSIMTAVCGSDCEGMADALHNKIVALGHLGSELKQQIIGLTNQALVVNANAASDFAVEFMPMQDGGLSIEVKMYDANGQQVNIPELNESFAKVMEQHKSAAGDPVDTATGAFTYRSTDLEVEGRGPTLLIERVYSSRAGRRGSVGINWTIPLFDSHLVVWTSAGAAQVVEAVWGDGQSSIFRWKNASEAQAPGFYSETPSDGILRLY